MDDLRQPTQFEHPHEGHSAAGNAQGDVVGEFNAGWKSCIEDLRKSAEISRTLETDMAQLRRQIAALEAERERYASIEGKAHLQTIDERDRAEEALSQAYYLVIGHSPEWSNLFGHEEAVEEIDDAQKCLRAEIAQQAAENTQLRSQIDAAAARTLIGSRAKETL